MKKKKSIAILTAAVLAGTMPSGVFAADSYKEAEKASVKKGIESFVKSYGENLDELNGAVDGKSNIKLTLEDTGKALIGMLLPVDFSWLSDMSFDANVSMKDNKMTELMDLYVNDSKICSVEYYMDSENMDVYMRIPELADGFIKVNMNAIQQTAEEAEAEVETDTGITVNTNEQMQEFMKMFENINEYMPEASVAESILDRYSTLVLDNLSDTGSEADTVTAGGVSEDCTLLEGKLTGVEVVPMAREILSTAKTDEELKGIIEKWTENIGDEKFSYDTFVEKIEELETQVAESNTDQDQSGFISRLWVDAEENVVGRQFAIIDDMGTTEPLFTYLSTSAENNRGYYLEFGDEDSDKIVIEGSGQMEGDLLNGSYTVSISGNDTFVCEVSGYDTAAMKDDVWNGNYSFSAVPVMNEDGTTIDPLGGLGMTMKVEGDKENSAVSLSMTMSGVPVFTIGISGGKGEGAEYVGTDSMEKIYDISVEEDMAAFEADMSLDTIMNNLTAAGMPETFIDDLTAAMSEPETEYYGDSAYGDEMTLEETEGSEF